MTTRSKFDATTPAGYWATRIRREKPADLWYIDTGGNEQAIGQNFRYRTVHDLVAAGVVQAFVLYDAEGAKTVLNLTPAGAPAPSTAAEPAAPPPPPEPVQEPPSVQLRKQWDLNQVATAQQPMLVYAQTLDVLHAMQLSMHSGLVKTFSDVIRQQTSLLDHQGTMLREALADNKRLRRELQDRPIVQMQADQDNESDGEPDAADNMLQQIAHMAAGGGLPTAPQTPAPSNAET